MDELLQEQLKRLSRLSHDLRGPLNTIYGAVQILQMHDSEDESRQGYYEAAQRGIRKMTRMVGNFTEYYCMTQAGSSFRPKLVDGRKFVESLCNAVQDCFMEQELELTVEIQGEGTVCLDEILMESAFLNLVSNGMKATKTKPCQLTVRAEITENGMSLSVQDYGVGIDPENQTKIFEPLIQLGNFDEGTGLGLSIVSEIVSYHKGELLLTSEKEKGSTFTIKLPLLTPAKTKSGGLKQPDLDMDRLQRTKIALADLL